MVNLDDFQHNTVYRIFYTESVYIKYIIICRTSARPKGHLPHSCLSWKQEPSHNGAVRHHHRHSLCSVSLAYSYEETWINVYEYWNEMWNDAMTWYQHKLNDVTIYKFKKHRMNLRIFYNKTIKSSALYNVFEVLDAYRNLTTIPPTMITNPRIPQTTDRPMIKPLSDFAWPWKANSGATLVFVQNGAENIMANWLCM